jgi:hypothetical protein
MSESKYYRHSETWSVKKRLFLPRLNNGGRNANQEKTQQATPPPTGRSRKPAHEGIPLQSC